MTEIYKFVPSQSRFTVQAFAGGILAALGHNPTFDVRDYSGEARFHDSQVEGLGLNVHVVARSLDLIDKVSESDRREISERMFAEVLEVDTFPNIAYDARNIHAERISPNESRLDIQGRLSLHGVDRQQTIHADLKIFTDGIRIQGVYPLRLSDYRIKPVTALGGAIKLKDDLRMTFDLFAAPEVP